MSVAAACQGRIARRALLFALLVGVLDSSALAQDLRSVQAGLDRAKAAVLACSLVERGRFIREDGAGGRDLSVMAYDGQKTYSGLFEGGQERPDKLVTMTASDGRYGLRAERANPRTQIGLMYYDMNKADIPPTRDMLAPGYKSNWLFSVGDPDHWVSDIVRSGHYRLGAPRVDGQIELIEHEGHRRRHRMLVDPRRDYIVTVDTQEAVSGQAEGVAGTAKVLTMKKLGGLYYPTDVVFNVTHRSRKKLITNRWEWRVLGSSRPAPRSYFKIFVLGATVTIDGINYRVTGEGKLEKLVAKPEEEAGIGRIKFLVMALAGAALAVIYLMYFKRTGDLGRA